MKNIVVWFSCGAASAVAAKLTLLNYPNDNVRIVNNPIKEEDEDNLRFLKDVEKWLGVKVETAINENYKACSAFEIWDKGYMSGIKGAPCTFELKKTARYQFEANNDIDFHVLGFTADEEKRFINFRTRERANTIPVLIKHGMTKGDCYRYLDDAGIEIPRIYRQGYPNANCIGCVKATSPTYWNHVRKVHPSVFKARSEQSKKIGCRLVRVKGERKFLDELLTTDKGRQMKDLDFECGIFCHTGEK